MNIGKDVDYGIHTTIPDFWRIMVDQYGDDFTFESAVNISHRVSKNIIIPMNTSTLFYPRIDVHVKNFSLHP
jgi:hypothetical protein